MTALTSLFENFSYHPGQSKLFLIAGPCVIESRDMTMRIAEEMAQITRDLNMPYIFKASLDKANRTSHDSYRGLGMDEGLRILEEVKATFKLPLLTDIHECWMVEEIAEVVDVLQIPAFLCRQTDLVATAAQYCEYVNIKKGQFMAPWGMQPMVDKAKQANKNAEIWLTERGASFGYGNLVSDMRALSYMKESGCPIVFDATHSVQLPGGLGHATGGQRQFVPLLSRAACAVGISGLFAETHPCPKEAKSDGPNAWPLDRMPAFLKRMQELDSMIQSQSWDDLLINLED